MQCIDMPGRASSAQPTGTHKGGEAKARRIDKLEETASQHAAALAKHLTGAAPERQDPAVSSDEALRAIARLEQHVPGGGPFLLVHLARPGDPRSWPEARYRELAREASRDEQPVVQVRQGRGSVFPRAKA